VFSFYHLISFAYKCLLRSLSKSHVNTVESCWKHKQLKNNKMWSQQHASKQGAKWSCQHNTNICTNEVKKNNIVNHNSHIMRNWHTWTRSHQFRYRNPIFLNEKCQIIKKKHFYEAHYTERQFPHKTRSNITTTQKEQISNLKLQSTCIPIIHKYKNESNQRIKKRTKSVYVRAIGLGKNDDLVGSDGFVDEFTHWWSWS